ncbi:MAG TPA: hypothetical protein VFG14_10190, partial [Chthoniobacteraceae bacterium]|nr:hypothetical protein [Chthoniobacteraceae bacterium]
MVLSPAIKQDDLKLEAAWLADPARAGRQTGTPGASATAEWLVNYCNSIGLKAVGSGTNVSYLQPFDFRAGERVIADRNSLGVTSDKKAGTFT